MNSFICIFVCVYQALQNSLVYTISVISVFVSYTYVCYVLVYFVLYVYNCMHKRTIKYLVSCILTRQRVLPPVAESLKANQRLSHFLMVQL